MRTINMFMWGYQDHFQVSAEVAAEGLFKELDRNLNPKVFLVGILHSKPFPKGAYPICIEPEDCGYDPSIFADVLSLADELSATDPENKLMHSHPVAQAEHENTIKLRALRNAIQTIISKDDEDRNVVTFCSWPILVNNYRVSIIIQLKMNILNSYYSLSRDKENVWNRFSIETSLIGATINEYLLNCTEALSKPEPGSGGTIIKRDYSEIIRSAGKNLMITAGWSGGFEFFGPYRLYHSCNVISSLRYEGEEGNGRMIISKKGHPNVEILIELDSYVSINDFRAVRKLLEISSKSISLLSNAEYIYGFGRLIGSYDANREDLFIANFTRHYTWELRHADKTMMCVSYEKPRLPHLPFDESKFRGDVARIFLGISNEHIDKLCSLVYDAVKQKHGTTVVISSGASEEADRLNKQCTKIKPVQLTNDLMQKVTAIDGAVLIDERAYCHAIGVILDGLASDYGDPSRGARYNSAIRYIETSSEKYDCIAIVISEDGTIDLLPDLLPQIKRFDIDSALLELNAINEAEVLDMKQYHRIMDWFKKHEFYLSLEVCTNVNDLRRQIQERIKINAKAGVAWIHYDDLKPNSLMNDSYFLD